MKTTMADIIRIINQTNPLRLTGEPPPYTEVFQSFINDNLNDPRALLEMLELFILDKLLPIDKKQYNLLLNIALKNNQIALLKTVPHGLSRVLIEVVKRGLDFSRFSGRFSGQDVKVSMDVTDEQGKTALHYAFEMKNLSQGLLEYLLDHVQNLEAFKPLIESFLKVPATSENKKAWHYLCERFNQEYADTQEAVVYVLEPAGVLDEVSSDLDNPSPSLVQDFSLFAPTRPTVRENESKRMKLM